MMLRTSIKHNASMKTRAYANDHDARLATFNSKVGVLPLTEALANVAVPSHVEGALRPTLKTSSLPNGIKIATYSSAHPLATVGLFVQSGSRYETSKNNGSSYFLQKFGLSETHGIDSELRLTRVLEGMNANYVTSSGREQIYYAGEVGSEHVDSFVSILFDVAEPQINEYEVIEKRDVIHREVHNIESNPRQALFEVLHQEAYKHKGLGQSLYPPTYNVNHITDGALKDFHRQTFTSKRLVLVGTGGVEHDKLVKIAADLTTDFPNQDGLAKPESPYVGGEARFGGDHETHLLLAFPGAGLSTREQYAFAVLQHILGGGRKIFKEGLGHVTSRLNRAIEKSHSLEEATAFNFAYSDSGLFGVHAIGHGGQSANLVREITSVLSDLKNVDSKEVDRAKQQFKASVHDAVDSRLNLLEFIGTQVISTGRVSGAADFAAGVDAVSVEEVRNVAKKALSSRPTLVALGDVENLPALDQIRSSFQ